MPSPHVFHAYDIRGLSPEEIDRPFACRLARAIIVCHRPRTVLIGRDMREMSVDLEEAVTRTFVDAGVDVVSIGLCTTPLFNVSVGLANGNIDIGIMITASHNPGTYNGFKLVYGDVRPLGQGSGMEELREAFENDEEIGASDKKGRVINESGALANYIDRVMKLGRLPETLPRRKIVIDAGNGMAGAVVPELLGRLPWLEVVPLYFELDGTFPHHEANPLKRETLHDLIEVVKREKADFGVAFDGDADRIGFVDETGEAVPGDIGIALFAQELLRENPGGLVLYDLRSSRSVPEAITQAGGRAEMCRVGHAYIKREMKEKGAVFAGEMSMHYYFRNLFNVESGDLALVYLLKRLAREASSLSQIWKPLATYAHSGEKNFTVQDTTRVFGRLKDAYLSRATSRMEIDGLRLEFCDPEDPENEWWFSVRASNTEPLLRLNVETRTRKQTEQKIKELSALIV